ncbi:1,4-dihydroxy-2-naphthoate octaprenyltransferase [bacterium]|nr:1,4-dihydroxy-2-naphthoate octaprenyltransferase [bacterium]
MTAAAASMGFGEKAKLWGVAVRAYSFPASIVPVLLGSAYAAFEAARAARAGEASTLLFGHFNWLFFAIALLAGVLYQIGVNLFNDYFDYLKGVDRPDTYGGSGVLVSAAMEPRQVLSGAISACAVGSLLGLLLLWMLYQKGPQFALPLLVIGIAGLLGVLWYSGGNAGAKYWALGSPLVFATMGVGMVLGAYVIQTGSFSWNAVWVSLPVSFLVAGILHANDTRDIEDDEKAKILTAGILLGPAGARLFYYFLLFSPYVSAAVLAALRILPWSALLCLLTLPLALPLAKVFMQVPDRKSEKLLGTVEGTAKLHLAFGVMLSLGTLLGVWLRW